MVRCTVLSRHDVGDSFVSPLNLRHVPEVKNLKLGLTLGKLLVFHGASFPRFADGASAMLSPSIVIGDYFAIQFTHLCFRHVASLRFDN